MNTAVESPSKVWTEAELQAPPGDGFIHEVVASGGFLDGENALQGFRYPIADLFADWDWD